MGIAKKTDGRYVVGLGVTDANDYKGSASYRDIYIQLTANGATAESVEYLTYLKDYAIYHNGLGEPIMPPSVNVWISNNGVTTAVEADDLSLDGDDFTICGIVYSGGTWDYSNAGSGHGGGSGLPAYTSADVGKVLGIVESSVMTADLIPEQAVSLTYSGHDGESDTATLNDCDWSNYAIGSSVSVIIDDDTYTATIQSGSDTTLKHFSVGSNPTFHFSLNEDGNTYLWAGPHENGTVNYVVKAGTVATANNPAWKMDGMPYVIHLTMTGPGTFTADKTFNEVSAAAADGAICIFEMMGKLSFGMEGPGAIAANFIDVYNNVLSSINIVYDSHGISATNSSYTLTPAT